VLLQGEWVHVTGAEHLLESLSPSQHSKSWPESFPPIYMHAGHSHTWETSTKLSFLLIVCTFWRPHYTLPWLYTVCILLSFWALVLLIYSLAASPSLAGWSWGCVVKEHAVGRLVHQPYIHRNCYYIYILFPSMIHCIILWKCYSFYVWLTK